MRKSIVYILICATILSVFAGGCAKKEETETKKKESTTAASRYNRIEEEETYPVAEEIVSEEVVTDEDGNPVELVTDEEGNTLQVVVETKANGEAVTKANGEKVTKKVTTTKKATTTKAGEKTTKKEGSTKASQKADTNATLVYNDDGSASIVKSDGSVALNYSYSANGNYFYTDDNPWQRSLGFNRLYDMGAAFTCMYYDTVRVKYTYGNYDWMIQMWKGQYGLIFIGSEIGLYYKDKSRSANHYDCATEDMEINMQMTLYRKDKELFTRPYAPHWWTTAFVPGKLTKFSDRSELIMIGKLTFKSEGERAAFVSALSKLKDPSGHTFKQSSSINKNNPETYRVSGNTVDFVWRYFDADGSSKPDPTTVPPTTVPPTTVPPTTVPPTTEPPTEPISDDAPLVD